ncbi:anti-sigma factor [Modestobacter sp. I12A-02628]|uniref:Regulator of SigK n=1 Tax=Goekera deserti TaxID=2497753 RepID=A0A7K3WC29_9ACTN|nr:anti-sigma factor [Goekera deserti]MPQ99204.1 anti-sigma factor [Goekera deserti]NDI47539.1 anti-sigma factor [Goekera deserti]NEL53350.1 anti-sigma factor [Goekera deserti]
MSGDLGARRPGDHDDHETLDELAVGWALHALEPEDEADFLAHLAGCARCERTVAETHEVMAAMATDLPPVEPSESLRHRLRAAVEQTEQVVRPSDAQPPAPLPLGVPVPDAEPAAAPLPGRLVERSTGSRARHGRSLGGRPAWRRVVPNALAAAAVAAALVVGTWNVVVIGERDDARQTVAEQADMMESLLRPGQARIAPLAGTDGHTVATVVAREGQLQVVANGMRPNDSDHTYVLWGMSDDAAPAALGTFSVHTADLDLRTVSSQATGLDDFTGYGISIEPGNQAPATPGDIVAMG